VEITLVPERGRKQHGVKFSIRIKFPPPSAKLHRSADCHNYNANILKRKTRISQLAVETCLPEMFLSNYLKKQDDKWQFPKVLLHILKELTQILRQKGVISRCLHVHSQMTTFKM
jgi:hypothetical protein